MTSFILGAVLDSVRTGSPIRVVKQEEFTDQPTTRYFRRLSGPRSASLRSTHPVLHALNSGSRLLPGAARQGLPSVTLPGWLARIIRDRVLSAGMDLVAYTEETYALLLQLRLLDAWRWGNAQASQLLDAILDMPVHAEMRDYSSFVSTMPSRCTV